MARKPVRGEEQFVLTGPMHKHLAALGQRSVTGYFAWCTQHGFASALKKSHKDLDAELAVGARQKADADRQSRLHRNPRKLISLRLPIEVIERWKATGAGWQTRMVERLSKFR